MKITEKDSEIEKDHWKEDRCLYNLSYPAEDVVKFLKRNYKSPETKVVLDFGCGSGRNTIPMADMGFGKIIAMDYNKDCLKLTEEKIKKTANVEYLTNERMEIPLENNSVDCIVAWGALFYFSEQERKAFAKEMYRVLKPEGMVAADFRGMDDELYGLGKEIEKNLFLLDKRAGHMQNFIYWFCDDKDLVQLYENEGFKVENIERTLQWSNCMKTKVDHYSIWLKKQGK